MYKRISDYGIIGNLRTVALVGLDGSIDWLCIPYIDSPSIFGALLDDQKGGRFSIFPLDEFDSMAEYVPDTNILKTEFRTRTGVMQVTDFMPMNFGDEEDSEERQAELWRIVEGLEGSVNVGLLFEPRFCYARATTSLERHGLGIIARGNGETVVLCSKLDLSLAGNKAEATFTVAKGDRLWLHLRYACKELTEIDAAEGERSLRNTEAYWQCWLKKSETARTIDFGPYENMINRSALVLKLLSYLPTGAIAAAATTSLPEELGGVRNWDYRFTWLRDTSLTLQALFNLGHMAETEGYLRWVERLIKSGGTTKLQIMYGLRGNEDLVEEELSHLDGYKGSRPVRIGNAAFEQRQLDIYGELMDAALKLSDYVGKIDAETWPFLRDICDYVVENWQAKDHGIWEFRTGPYHFVYSKVMCWVALDRGITIASRYGFRASLPRWEETRSKIKDDVLNSGWSEKKRAFIQNYGSEALDSSNLLLPILGFLPFDDPHVVSTSEGIQRELGHDCFLFRYLAEDGLPGREGAFLICSFWLIQGLVGLGRFEQAELMLHRLEGVANHLGLFSEEYDFNWKQALGNFPQALTHIGYVNSVVALLHAKERMLVKPKEDGEFQRKRLLLGERIFLNDGQSPFDMASREMAAKLKSLMNILRGAFFDTAAGRVAYEEMSKSKAYGEYVELSYALRKMDLDELKGREERLAFWINLYNVIVMHGVIELGIRDSVKEVRQFFKRIYYQIDGMSFNADDIEHGILRANSRPPYSVMKLFRAHDKRLDYAIEPMDPRIHFALVCASSSCPPIEVYTAENIDKELTVAGQTFLNTDGIQIDRRAKRVWLSRIFKWYGGDFGPSEAKRLKCIAPYLYDDEDRRFIDENAETMKVEYREYDWRLNRT